MAQKFLSNLSTALNQVGLQIVKAMQANLQRNKSNASGNLSKSIESEVVGQGDDLRLRITMEPYGEFVDQGRGRSTKGGPRQNWANKIEGWMQYKGITPKGGLTKKQVAFLITRKINQKGYKAKPFIQPAVDQIVERDLDGILGTALAKDVETILTKKR